MQTHSIHRIHMLSLGMLSALLLGVATLFAATHPSSTTASVENFLDVSRADPGYDAIAYVRQRGIVEGYPDGTFRPDRPISRAEFVKIMIGATSDAMEMQLCMLDQGEIPLFSDVPSVSGIWYGPSLCVAKRKNIISGYPDGTFQPSRTISVAEAVKILTLAFDIPPYPVDEGQPWYAPYSSALQARELLPPSIVSAGQLLTRREMSQIVAAILRMKPEGDTALQGPSHGAASASPESGGTRYELIVPGEEAFSAEEQRRRILEEQQKRALEDLKRAQQNIEWQNQMRENALHPSKGYQESSDASSATSASMQSQNFSASTASTASTASNTSTASPASAVSSAPSSSAGNSVAHTIACVGYTIGLYDFTPTPGGRQMDKDPIHLSIEPDGNTYLCTGNREPMRNALAVAFVSPTLTCPRMTGETVTGKEFNPATNFFDLVLNGPEGRRVACSDQIARWFVADEGESSLQLLSVVGAQRTNARTIVPGAELFEVATTASEAHILGQDTRNRGVASLYLIPARLTQNFLGIDTFARQWGKSGMSIQPFTVPRGGVSMPDWYYYGEEDASLHLPLRDWQADLPVIFSALRTAGYPAQAADDQYSNILITTAARVNARYPNLLSQLSVSAASDEGLVVVMGYKKIETGYAQYAAVLRASNAAVLAQGTYQAPPSGL